VFAPLVGVKHSASLVLLQVCGTIINVWILAPLVIMQVRVANIVPVNFCKIPEINLN